MQNTEARCISQTSCDVESYASAIVSLTFESIVKACLIILTTKQDLVKGDISHKMKMTHPHILNQNYVKTL